MILILFYSIFIVYVTDYTRTFSSEHVLDTDNFPHTSILPHNPTKLLCPLTLFLLLPCHVSIHRFMSLHKIRETQREKSIHLSETSLVCLAMDITALLYLVEKIPLYGS